MPRTAARAGLGAAGPDRCGLGRPAAPPTAGVVRALLGALAGPHSAARRPRPAPVRAAVPGPQQPAPRGEPAPPAAARRCRCRCRCRCGAVVSARGAAAALGGGGSQAAVPPAAPPMRSRRGGVSPITRLTTREAKEARLEWTRSLRPGKGGARRRRGGWGTPRGAREGPGTGASSWRASPGSDGVRSP